MPSSCNTVFRLLNATLLYCTCLDHAAAPLQSALARLVALQHEELTFMTELGVETVFPRQGSGQLQIRSRSDARDTWFQNEGRVRDEMPPNLNSQELHLQIFQMKLDRHWARLRAMPSGTRYEDWLNHLTIDRTNNHGSERKQDRKRARDDTSMEARGLPFRGKKLKRESEVDNEAISLRDALGDDGNEDEWVDSAFRGL